MRRASKLDLALGVVLGLVLGVAVTYVLVMGIGNSKDSSSISPATPAKTRGEARKGTPPGAAHAPPAQRR